MVLKGETQMEKRTLMQMLMDVCEGRIDIPKGFDFNTPFTDKDDMETVHNVGDEHIRLFVLMSQINDEIEKLILVMEPSDEDAAKTTRARIAELKGIHRALCEVFWTSISIEHDLMAAPAVALREGRKIVATELKPSASISKTEVLGCGATSLGGVFYTDLTDRP